MSNYVLPLVLLDGRSPVSSGEGVALGELQRRQERSGGPLQARPIARLSNQTACHTCTDPSPLAEAICLPSGNHTTACTESAWARKVRTLLCAYGLVEAIAGACSASQTWM